MVWKFLKKLKINLPYELPIPFLIYIQSKRNKHNKDIPACACLFRVAKTWCPLTDE
jgi:hypothetical protein